MNKNVVVPLVILAVGLVAASPVNHYRMGVSHRFEPVAGEEVNYVSFANGIVIDTRVGEPNLPAGLATQTAPGFVGYYIIQFEGPIRREWVRELERNGISAFGYLPNYAMLGRLSEEQRDLVRSLPGVRWVGLFQPAYKLQQALLDANGFEEVTIQLMPGETGEAVEELIKANGGTVVEALTTGFATTVRAGIAASHLPEIARLQEVFWVEKWVAPEICNNQCQWVTQTGWQSSPQPDTALSVRTSWLRGVRGRRVILSTTDTGLNLGHDLFRDPALPVNAPGIWPDHRKVVAFKLYQGANPGETPYHGSHVNGTVAGDDSVTGGSSYYDGMSFKGRLYFVDLTNAGGGFVIGSDLTPLWDSVYLGRGLPDSVRPILQHSGSWGASNNVGDYKLMDASTDAYCWAHKDFLNIFAAGNEANAHTIRNPGIAKNVLTVGATYNGTSSNTIAGFSSRGPTQDNRIKPAVMAPGVNLWSAQASGTNGYSQMSGTSMATPAVNGSVGLMRCYLREGCYPTGSPVPGNRIDYISSALLRSMAIASCDPNVGSYVVPSFDIGWGRIDDDSVLYYAGDLRRLALKDDTAGIGTGEYREEQFVVNSSIPLRIALAWTDTAAAPNANPTLVNDLNLEVTDPNGTYYRGNQYSGGQSEPNPAAWDNRNVEECVRVNSPATGTWTIRVRGQNVATAAKQSFAYTITGDVSSPTSAVDAGVKRIIAPAGTVDSGATEIPRSWVANYGSTAATFPVTMRIGTGYSDTKTVTDLAPGDSALVMFSIWNATERGTLPVCCSTGLAGDQDPTNDTLLRSVTVQVTNVGVTAIVAPTDTFDTGATVTPEAWVINSGTGTVSFPVFFRIGSFYSDSQNVSGLAPGDSALLSFTPWNATQRGTHTTRCTTALSGDVVPANDMLSGSVTIRVTDVGVSGISKPVGTYGPREVVTPVATVRNYGNVPTGFEVWMLITDPNGILYYSDSLAVANLDPANNLVLNTFQPCTLRLLGDYAVKCSTALVGDVHPQNDVMTGGFAVRSQWVEMNSMPEPPSYRQVKDGAWLAYDAGSGLIYAAKGNKTGDFYSYNVSTGEWATLRDIPAGLEHKLPRRGACGAADGSGYVYMAKGNNTLGFWRYDVTTDTWIQLANVPAGGHRKVRAGAAVYVQIGDSGYIYLLKGPTCEFYRFNVATWTWETMQPAPMGNHAKWYAGSFLAFDGDHTIYAHKGRYHELWAYDVLTDRWNGTRLAGMPFVGRAGRSRKSRDGGSGAWFEGTIYALKGGSTTECWCYNATADAWTEFDSLPPLGKSGKIRKVYAGAGMVNVDGTLFALKGNKTNELWRYALGYATVSQPSREGVMSAQVLDVLPSPFDVNLSPNPASSPFVTLSLSRSSTQSLAPSTPRSLSVSVFNASGRLVQPPIAIRQSPFRLDLRSMPAGVYLVRVGTGDLAVTQKLVIER
jgi:hypothetical protein